MKHVVVALAAVLGWMLSAATATAEPVTHCPEAIAADVATKIFTELKPVGSADGCEFLGLKTDRDASTATWSRAGRELPAVIIAPRRCLSGSSVTGPALAASIPQEV